jgi:hypothetical protein
MNDPWPSVSEEEFAQMCDDLTALTKAWQDRLCVAEGQCVMVLLQVGASMSAAGGVPIEMVNDLVEHAWNVTAEDLPAEDLP